MRFRWDRWVRLGRLNPLGRLNQLDRLGRLNQLNQLGRLDRLDRFHRLGRLAALLALIILMGVGYSASAASDAAEEVIDRVLDLSGTTEMLATFPDLVDRQVAAQLGRFEGKDAELFRDVMRAAFDPRQLRSTLTNAMLERYDETHAESTMAWYSSALGSKIRQLEARSHTAEAQQEIAEFAQSFQTTPPSAERVEAAKRLDAATRSSETAGRVMLALMRGMVSGIASLEEGEAPAPDELAAVMEEQMNQLAPLIRNQTLATMLFAARSLSDSELSSYLAYVESEGGRWFHGQMGAGLTRAMARAGDAFGSFLSALMEDKKRSFSKPEAEQLRESAIGEGRAFGKTTQQTACMDEAFARRNACRDFICFARAEIFLEGCLETSRREASLCAGAPSEEDLIASVYWRFLRCEERGTTTPGCNRLMGTVEEYCASPRVSL